MNSDRSIQQLYKVSSGIGPSTHENYRDASNARTSGSEHKARSWGPARTPITVPSNTPARPMKSTNPYSGRMGDTLSASSSQRNTLSASGNVTASRTILKSEKRARGKPKAPPKYQSHYFSENADASGSASRAVNVSSDEDTGEIVPRNRNTSPDPIASFTDDDTAFVWPRSNPSSSSSSRNQLEFRPGNRSKRGPAPDGASTQRLARKLQARDPIPAEVITIDDDDVAAEPPTSASAAIVPDDGDTSDLTPIEASDDPSPSKPGTSSTDTRHTSPTLAGIPKRKVLTTVEQFEKPQTEPSSVSSAIPNTARSHKPLELRPTKRNNVGSFNLPGSAALGAKHRMKGKNGTLHLDFASQPTNFVSKQANKGKVPKQSTDIRLPLKEWAIGKEHHDHGSVDWLVCDGENISVRENATSKDFIVKFNIQNHVGTVLCTAFDVNFPVIIQLKTRGASQKNKTLYKSPKFDHGAHGPKGYLLFSFKVDHPNWEQGEPYNRLCETLLNLSSEKYEILSGADARSAWDSSYSIEGDDRPHTKRRNTSDTDSMNKDHDLAGPSLARSMSRTSLIDDDPPEPPARRTYRRSIPNDGPARLTRSTTRAQEEPARRSPVTDPDELILVFPFSGQGAVNVTRGDIKRLEPGQYLNDTLIEFGLKWWLNDLRGTNPELAEQIHVFSSFFYKKISVRDKKEGYQSVRKWTSKFDLFKKKYLIVPINENLHWYLAIICNPEYVLQPPPPTPPKLILSVQTRKRKRDPGPNAEQMSVEPPQSDTRPATPQRSRSVSEVDETSVEALLTDSHNVCQEQAETPPEPAEKDPPVVDALGGLQYPPSEPDPMEVDPPLEEQKTENVQPEQPGPSAEVIEIDVPPPKPEDNDPEIVEVVDVPMETDTTVNTNSVTSGIPASRFYSSGQKGKSRALSPEVPHPETVATSMDSREPGEADSSDGDPNKTWIFTFDSLGSKHPAAITNLKNYLQLEAQDKKGLELTATTPAEGKIALVPWQNNFCDCGVYLIHFVRIFMKDPKRATDIILRKKGKDYSSSSREEDWNAQGAIDFRAELLACTLSLSDQWKADKAAKEEQRKREAEAGAAATASEGGVESDDDIIVGEVISKSKATAAAKAKGKAKAKAAAPEGETKADRLR